MTRVVRRWGEWALIPLAVSTIPLVSVAAADPLSCDTFRERLVSALLVADATGAPEAPIYRETGRSPDGSTRFAWSTPSLDGSMSCGSTKQFREFYVSLIITSKDRFVDQLKRFMAMNGAAICVTNDGTSPACVDAGKALLQNGLQQMGAAFQRKVSAPSGLASRLLQPHLEAELTAAPSLITFTLDVTDAADFDEVRAPLPPLPQGPLQQP